MNVSKQDDQRTKCTLTACRIAKIKGTPPARFRDLQYPLWVVNTDLFLEYDSAGFVPKGLFNVMMLGKDLIYYGETDVVYRIVRDMQRLWRIEKEKDPTTVPFYHARWPVYSWASGSVTTEIYQFDEHTMRIGTTSLSAKQVYLPLLLFSTPLRPHALLSQLFIFLHHICSTPTI